MAIWTKELTWQFNINQATASSGSIQTDARTLMSKIVTALLGFASGAPSVWKATDGSGSAPSPDTRWDSAAKVINASAGANHSWMVVTFPAGWQMLIDMNNATYAYYGTVIISPGALFTDGSATTAPTATDGVTLINGASWTYFDVSKATKLHVMLNSTGACFRLFVFSGGAIIGRWVIDTLTDVVPTTVAWTVPVVGSISYNSFILANAAGTYWLTRWNGTNYTGFMTGEYGYSNTWIPQMFSGIPNDTNAAYGGEPVGFACSTAGFRGKQGRFRDLWIGSQAVAQGDSYPVAQPDFVQIGEYILPWDGVNAMQMT